MSKIVFFLVLCAVTTSFITMQERISMTIIVSTKNHYFYYDNKLKKDGSNFKVGWSRDIREWAHLLEEENGKDNILFILKVQNKDSLNETSNKLIEHFKSKPHYKQSKITQFEKLLVEATERINYQ